METIEILRDVSSKVFENVKNLAGTPDAAGNFGRGAGGDISRRIDIVAEKTVLDFLKEKKIDWIVLGEECGKVELSETSSGYLIMDAIDGSANAVRGVPFFCCSLAFAKDEKLSSVEDAVVTDLVTGDQYWATKGKGAYLNKARIHVHRSDPIYRIVGVNTSGATPQLMKSLQPIFESHNHTRHFGANALEMAMFAAGLMDIFIDLRKKIRIQDIAAGYLLIKEAGGLILDENLKELDSDFNYETRLSFIAVTNKKMLEELVCQLNISSNQQE